MRRIGFGARRIFARRTFRHDQHFLTRSDLALPSLPKAVLHEHVVEALGADLVTHGPFDEVPFRVEVKGLVPLAIYAFTVSDPPGGREPDELKIQLIAPGQERGKRGNFDAPDDESYVILLGYSPDYEVFVLWDAYKHRDFAWSKNCQTRLAEIKDAQISGTGFRYRVLGSGAWEQILVARPDHLATAFGQRVRG